jgi:hypothetical protein
MSKESGGLLQAIVNFFKYFLSRKKKDDKKE